MNSNILILLFIIATLFPAKRGWTHPETGWEVLSGPNMSIITFNNVYINNGLAEGDHRDAIAVFYENQCLGWAYYQESITFVPAIGNDGSNPSFPNDNDILNFFIYDKSQNTILELQSLEEFPIWLVNTMPNIQNSIGCQFNIQIDSNGECVELCDYSPNLDHNIDILDIMYMLSNFILCLDCSEGNCGDLNSDGTSDVYDIIILINLILDTNNNY